MTTSHLEFCKLKEGSSHLPLITQLYIDAFPACERRDVDEWLSYSQPNTGRPFTIYVVEYKGEFAGFITCWDFTTFVYVEHFAVSTNIRGLGIGQQTLALLKQEVNNRPLVLEVEVPEGEMPIRRIRFYERQAFFLSPLPYMQPPYRAGEDWFELRLMTTHPEFLTENFEEVKRTIYQHVYQVKDED